MNAPASCREPIGFETLLAYWFGELDDAATQAIDLHLLGCEACGAQVDALAALGDGVRAAFDAGAVGAVVHGRFTQRLAERGLRVREYRVVPGGSVNCTIEPGDDVMVSRLGAALAGITRLDLVRLGAPGEPDVRAADIPFEADSGEVVLVVPAQRVRQLPDGVERVRLFAVEAGGERVLGEYAFKHRAMRG